MRRSRARIHGSSSSSSPRPARRFLERTQELVRPADVEPVGGLEPSDCGVVDGGAVRVHQVDVDSLAFGQGDLKESVSVYVKRM